MEIGDTAARPDGPPRKRQKVYYKTKAASTGQACVCQSLEDFQSVLKDHLSSGLSALIPELVTCHISLAGGATIYPNYPRTQTAARSLAGQDAGHQHADKDDDQGSQGTPITVNEAVNFTGVVKETLAKQRALARGIGVAVEAVDGNKYHINNTWIPKSEEGHRFALCCQDSIQNKDRLLNENNKRFSLNAKVAARGIVNCE